MTAGDPTVGIPPATVVEPGSVADLASVLQAMAPLDPASVLFVTAAATALVGAVVAAIAYRGYRRNDSESMGFLALGIVCFAVAPFLLTYGVGPVAALSDAETLLSVLCANIAGLLAVLHSLDGV
ncbi:DUF7521 family protein [Halorarum halobium]|uniref:DUF7521 family protein n=1 Tax=Halorarum halobium TaxID=3075121 RepID=UPI0028AD0CCB|nr:hypothetical protein [Halobaculum sp. XH14]